MNNKIQKVGVVTLKNHLIINQSPAQHLTNSEDQIMSIHSYFVMLRHIFQKNKQVMRKRNQFSQMNKSDSNRIQAKTQRTDEKFQNNTQQSFGILKNCSKEQCGFIKKGQNRHYRPYKSKNRSLNVTAKSLSSSVPNINQQKDEAFKPIGQKYYQCKLNSNEKPRSLSKSRAEFATCINFYPRYEKQLAKSSKVMIEFNKNQLKKDRKTLLTARKQTITQQKETEQLRSSHKSAYSNKSHLSMATESSEIPSPW